jgi:hypothetical protein
MERRKGQRYGSELRRQAVERMNACGNIVGLARPGRCGSPLTHLLTHGDSATLSDVAQNPTTVAPAST